MVSFDCTDCTVVYSMTVPVSSMYSAADGVNALTVSASIVDFTLVNQRVT